MAQRLKRLPEMWETGIRSLGQEDPLEKEMASHSSILAVLCLVTKSCPTLCDPLDGSPPGSSVQGVSPGKYNAVGCHALLQGVFPIQGSNPGLPHRRRILLLSDPHGKPQNPGVGSLSLLQENFLT